MNERIRIIPYKEIQAMYVDCSGLREDDTLLIQIKMTEFAIKEKIRLVIINIENTHATEKIKKGSEKSIADMEAKLGKIRITMLGLAGIQKIIANAISKDLYFAKNIDDALRWLAEQAKALN